MVKGKSRTSNHITESKSLNIIQKLLPDEWVIRAYTPDYGIDLSIEIFENLKKNEYFSETLGEHIFVQLKGTTKLNKGTRKIYKRINESTSYNKDLKREVAKVSNVIKFKLDTSLLVTVERMSLSVPVILFVVDIINIEAYFICLNDYIEKVLLPENCNYDNQKTITIDIPLTNKLNEDGIQKILFYSKRPKFYSFFNKVKYQNEIINQTPDENLLEQCLYFAKKLLRLDIWSIESPFIKDFHDDLQIFLKKQSFRDNDVIKTNVTDLEQERIWETPLSEKLFTREEIMEFIGMRTFWERLNSISSMYEDSWFELYLPTYYYEVLCKED